MRVRTAELAVSAVLSALAIAIPLIFRGTPLQIVIPSIQYTGTAASHVPSMIAMAVGPTAAALVGLSSTLGFLVTINVVVAARAFTHAVWGVLGAYYFRKTGSYVKALFLVALPIHSVGEGFVVYALGPVFGLVSVAAEIAGFWVFLGTVIHHMVDSAISLAVIRVLAPVLAPLMPQFMGLIKPTARPSTRSSAKR